MEESREGALIQVVDAALPAEKKTKPNRALIAITVSVVSFILLVLLLIGRRAAGRAMQDPLTAQRWAGVRASFRRG